MHRETWQARFRNQLAELEARTGLHGAFAPSYVQWGGGFGNAILTRGQLVRAEVHPLPCSGEPRALLEATVRIDGATISGLGPSAGDGGADVGVMSCRA